MKFTLLIKAEIAKTNENFKFTSLRLVLYPADKCKHVGISTFERRHEKSNILVFEQVQHKPGCAGTEDG